MSNDCNSQAANPPAGPSNLQPGGSSFDQGPAALPHVPDNRSGAACAAIVPVIRIKQARATRVRQIVRDFNGVAVDLGPTISGDSIPDDGIRVFMVCRHSHVDASLLWVQEGSIVDAASGTVEFSLTKDQTDGHGIYATQILVTDQTEVTVADIESDVAPEGYLFTADAWMEIIPALTRTSVTGPPTISEMRMFLRDACPEGNDLLQDFEFNDTEIIYALNEAVGYFNVKYVPRTRYGVPDFPHEYRYFWVRAAASSLLRTAARKYARDHLPYTGGGQTVDPKNKFGVYTGLADQLWKEWDTFVAEEKGRLQMRRGWSSFGSTLRQ